MLLDRSAKQPLVMFSVEGGVDIEEVAEKTPEKLIRHHVDPLQGLSREEAVEIATAGGVDADVIEGVADALVALYEVWLEEDATLAEINPLIVTGPSAGRAKCGRSTRRSRSTATRSTATPRTRRSPTARTKTRSSAAPRKRASSTSSSTATSASSATAPASSCRRSTSSRRPAARRPTSSTPAAARTPRRSSRPSSLILANDAVKAVLFNIFGGITRCDEVAKGLIAAFEEIKPSVPFVVRLDGTNDVEGRRLLQEAALPERARREDDERGGREGRRAGRRAASVGASA